MTAVPAAATSAATTAPSPARARATATSARRSGAVVPKAELLAHVWDDPDEIADLNVVEVYVGYLRRKIDAPFGRKSVQTVRGAGYLLAGDGG